MLVLGAGLAGLAAAAALTSHGVDVLVLDARSRVGGRVRTLRERSHVLPLELGAEFLHGPAPAVTALASEAGLTLVDVPSSHWRNEAGRLTEDRHFEQGLARALARCAAVVRSRGERSFASALRAARVREPYRALARAYVEGFQAADAERISMRALSGDDPGMGGIRRVLAGCQGLAEHLRARIPPERLRLNARVRAVHWRPGRVEARGTLGPGTTEFALRAERALVTLPLGALAADAGGTSVVRFEPGLPGKTRARARLAMGEVVKIVLVFRDAFWEELAPVRAAHDASRIVLLHAPGEAFHTWWTTLPLRAPVLTAWAGGSAARGLAGLDEPRLLARALADCARAFRVPPAAVERGLLSWHRHDWSADPFAGGAYSYPLVGGARAARILAAPVAETLFFAGEATAPAPDNGTMEGALASGKRAAEEVLAALGSSSARPPRRARLSRA